jgi:FlaA1/EpsC-like NDP-sugar epimerase
MEFFDFLKKRRKVFLFIIDSIIFAGVFVLSALLHSVAFSESALQAVGYVLCGFLFYACMFSSRLLFMVYFNVWRYANTHSFLMVILADFFGGLLAVTITAPFEATALGMQSSIGIITGTAIMTILSRLVYQQGYRYFHRGGPLRNKIGVAIVGAGTVGALLAE